MARIGLVAHDDKKDELCAWAVHHKHKLAGHELWGTGTTGGRVIAATGNIYSGLWYPIVIAAATHVIGLLFVRETKDIDIYQHD